MNFLTNSMNRVTKMLMNVDGKLKDYGKEPYGVRKLTPQEQRERIQNMSPEELYGLIQEHGVDSVNQWLQKYWQEPAQEDRYGLV